MCTVHAHDVVFALGTPVFCCNMRFPGLEDVPGDIRGFDERRGTYSIVWEGKIKAQHEVKVSNIRVASPGIRVAVQRER